MIEENPLYTVRKLADALKIPRTTIRNHLTMLYYVNCSVLRLPYESTERNILDRVSIFDMLLNRYKKHKSANDTTNEICMVCGNDDTE